MQQPHRRRAVPSGPVRTRDLRERPCPTTVPVVRCPLRARWGSRSRDSRSLAGRPKVRADLRLSMSEPRVSIIPKLIVRLLVTLCIWIFSIIFANIATGHSNDLVVIAKSKGQGKPKPAKNFIETDRRVYLISQQVTLSQFSEII
jgi:hypothetical protein